MTPLVVIVVQATVDDVESVVSSPWFAKPATKQMSDRTQKRSLFANIMEVNDLEERLCTKGTLDRITKKTVAVSMILVCRYTRSNRARLAIVKLEINKLLKGKLKIAYSHGNFENAVTRKISDEHR